MHFVNPFRSVLGIGDYDVQILQVALSQRDFETTWCDVRKPVSLPIVLESEGFLCNVSVSHWWRPSTRHWFSIKRLATGDYVNLDPKLPTPTLFDSPSTLVDFLNLLLLGEGMGEGRGGFALSIKAQPTD
jgi:josephin